MADRLVWAGRPGGAAARIVSTAGMSLTSLGLALFAVLIGPATNEVLLASLLGVVGIGSGLFLTPNTSAIMSSVSPHRRGIANGLRSMLQNAGMVVSTALGLAIVTSGLSSDAKAAAYAGTLSAQAVGVFTESYRAAFGVLAGLAACGVVASLLRTRSLRS